MIVRNNYNTDNSTVSSLPEDTLDHIKATARRMYDGASGSHDWDHTLRVYRLCGRIGKAERADMDVVRVAALLHDIGRSRQDVSNGELCHARQGAQMARDIIQGLPLNDDQKNNIIHCIRPHRFREALQPQTVEAKVLYDADKLDAIGAVGVARAFLFAGEVGARLHNPDMKIEESKSYTEDDTGYREYSLKLRKIKDRMLTGEGKKLAE